MVSWEKLAEERIQEWMRSAKSVERKPSPDAVAPLELQLFNEVLALYDEARASADPSEAQAKRAEARDLEIRLLVVLENSGRPLAAHHFAKLLERVRGAP